MVELLCVLLPFLFGSVVFLLPAVLDLVIRDERVPLWYPAPLLLGLPFLPLVLIAPQAQPQGLGRVMVSHIGWAMFHTGVAGALLVLACGLAFSRGLRPGGPTLRRRRTSAFAILALLFLLIVPWLPGGWPLAWSTPACWAGLFWVLALNRRGAGRLERGKSASAAYLIASFLSFGIGAAHGLRVVNLEGTWMSVGQWIAIVTGAVVLAGGFRVLSGPPDAGPVLVAAASAVTLVVPALHLWMFDPVPDDVTLPVWEDFGGERWSAPDTIDRAGCVDIVRRDGSRVQQGDCTYWTDVVIADREVILLELPHERDVGLAVGNGHYQTPRWGRWQSVIMVTADAQGRATLQNVDGTNSPPIPPELVGPHPLDATLSAALREAAGTERQLLVVASEHWTIQDYVSMCASLTAPASCEFQRSRPQTWP